MTSVHTSGSRIRRSKVTHKLGPYQLAPGKTNTSFFKNDNDDALDEENDAVRPGYEPRGSLDILQCFTFCRMLTDRTYETYESVEELKKYVLRAASSSSNARLWDLPNPERMKQEKLRLVCTLCKARKPTPVQGLKEAKKHRRMHPVEPIENQTDPADTSTGFWDDLANKHGWPIEIDWEFEHTLFQSQTTSELLPAVIAKPETSGFYRTCKGAIETNGQDALKGMEGELRHGGYFGPEGLSKFTEWTLDYVNSKCGHVTNASVRPFPSVKSFAINVLVPSAIIGHIRYHCYQAGEEHTVDAAHKIWNDSAPYGRAVRPLPHDDDKSQHGSGSSGVFDGDKGMKSNDKDDKADDKEDEEDDEEENQDES